MSEPTWYDLLDVEPTATADEIRAAWRSRIEDLDPTDRRFQRLNDAAAVLLDADRRREYDARLAPATPTSVSGDGQTPASDVPAAAEPTAPRGPGRLRGLLRGPEGTPAEPAGEVEATEEAAPAEDATAEPAARRPARVAPVWVLATLGVAAAALVAASGVSFAHGAGSGENAVTVENSSNTVSTVGDAAGKPLTYQHVINVESDGASALDAAKTAVVPVLSYDYRHMAQSKQQAEAYLTDAYKAEYEKLFALLQQNAPNTRTVVKTNPPVDAGVVRVSPGRVEVLVFVDRPTTNKQHTQPVNYQNYVTLTMQKVGDRWLVDNMETTPSGS
jgi:Mce-associated membrane protein